MLIREAVVPRALFDQTQGPLTSPARELFRAPVSLMSLTADLVLNLTFPHLLFVLLGPVCSPKEMAVVSDVPGHPPQGRGWEGNPGSSSPLLFLSPAPTS